MFTRSAFKEQALKQLSQHWKVPLLISLAIAITMGILLIPIFIAYIMAILEFIVTYDRLQFINRSDSIEPFIYILQYLVMGIIIISMSRFYISFTKDNTTKFATFLKGLTFWLKGIQGYVWMLLWTFLWSLLLIIPGVVKAMAYSQIFFIIADNPTVGVRRAMKLSMAITQGYKADLFIMHLSFMGWALLSVLTFNIGLLWFYPYYITSFTYAYEYLKKDALDRKILTHADFGQKEPIQAFSSLN